MFTAYLEKRKGRILPMKIKKTNSVFIGILTWVLFFASATYLPAQKPNPEWQQRKFSMFIHFGLYSQLGGVWDGKPVEWGYSEQIQSFAGIFSDWYAATAQTFNPLDWNPDSIVQSAQKAGMKSIVITAKHHDGFCLFHSHHTPFNIVDATPYKRDLIQELSEACARKGMPFGLYFSLIDWHFPQAYPISSHNADPITPEHHRFNKQQVQELMTRYGKISEIWFDMGSLTPQQSEELYELVTALQPDCMISGRLGNDYCDFAVMSDNAYPNYFLSMPWQTAASMFEETWGFRSWQNRGMVKDKVKEKIRSLVQVVGRGGNFLLNIGPDGNGKVVDFEEKVLLEMGKWLGKYKHAIYATERNPFAKPFEWGEITQRDNNLFLFIKEEYAQENIVLKGITTPLHHVEDLTTGKKVKVKQKGDTLCLLLSSMETKSFDEGEFRVISIEFKQKPIIEDIPKQEKNTVLDRTCATVCFGHSLPDYYGSYKSITAYQWHIGKQLKNVNLFIEYPEQDSGRNIAVKVGETQRKYTLSGGMPKEHHQPKGIEWGGIFVKRSGAVFGDLAEEQKDTLIDTNAEPWKPWEHFQYGKRYELSVRKRSAMVILQEITTPEDAETAVEITAGNALYVLLNGEYVTADFPMARLKEQKTFLLLPLKKGKNQLVVKCYNRHEETMPFAMTFPTNWKTYLLPCKGNHPMEKNTNTITLTRGDNMRPATPLCLPNVKLKLQE